MKSFLKWILYDMGGNVLKLGNRLQAVCLAWSIIGGTSKSKFRVRLVGRGFDSCVASEILFAIHFPSARRRGDVYRHRARQ